MRRRTLLTGIGAASVASAAHALTPAQRVLLQQHPTTDYFASDGATFPLYGAATRSQALYDSTGNTTWFAHEGWRNSLRCCIVTTYNHTTRWWSPEYVVAAASNVSDDHGNPSIVMDNSGYVHIFWDGHAAIKPWVRHAHTTNPRDPRSWTVDAPLPSPATYPHPHAVGSTLRVYYRVGSDDSQLGLFKTTSLSGGVAQLPASPTILVNWGGSNAFYQGYEFSVGTDIYIFNTDGLADDTGGRQNLYCYVNSTTDESVRNIDSSVTIASGSLPISKATSDASFCILSQTGAQITNIPTACVTSDGLIHVVYLEGLSNGSSWNVQYKNWNGSTWSTPTTVTTTDDHLGFHAVVSMADNSLELYLTADPGALWFRGGNIVRFARTAGAGGSWGSSTTIRTSSGAYPLDECSAVKDAHADARVIFAETNTTNSASSSTDPSGATGLLKVYAYGASGLLKRRSNFAPVSSQEFQDAIVRKAAFGTQAANGFAFDFRSGGYGQAISRALSRAPGQRAASQGNGGGQPTYTAGSPGYASFAGAQGVVSDITPGSTFTMAACFRGGATGNQLAMGVTGAVDGRAFIGLISGVAKAGFGALTGTDLTTGQSVSGQDIVLLLRTDGVNVELWMNGTRYSQVAVNGAPASVVISVGNSNNNGTAGNFLTGRIYTAFAAPVYVGGSGAGSDLDNLMRMLGRGVVTW